MGKITAILAVLFAMPGFSLLAAQTFSIDIPMSDGVKLSTDIYALTLDPQPVVLIRTPYDKKNFKDTGLAYAALWNAKVIIQDTRGQGSSNGIDTVFRNDAADGIDTLKWVEALGWSNGTVGSWGPSALAITQMLMAPYAPSVYKCQYTIFGTHSISAQVAYSGGVRRVEIDNWLKGQKAYNVIDEWNAHPDPEDPYWEPVTATEAKLSASHTAGVHLAGWFDIFTQGSLDWFAGLQYKGGEGAKGNQLILIGPWTHGGKSGELQFPDSEAQAALTFYDEAWKSGCLHQTGDSLEKMPALRVYVMGASGEAGAPGNSWEELVEWPPQSGEVVLFMSAGGKLSVTPSQDESAATSYSHSPSNPVPSIGGNNLTIEAGPKDQALLVEMRPDVAVFSSDPLAEPVKVVGRLKAGLWLETGAEIAHVALRLTDVYPDGRSMLMASGIKKFKGAGKPEYVEVDLWSTALVFNKGHRIRVSVAGSMSKAFAIAPAAFSAKILHDAVHKSGVVLPVVYGLSNPPSYEQEPEKVEVGEFPGEEIKEYFEIFDIAHEQAESSSMDANDTNTTDAETAEGLLPDTPVFDAVTENSVNVHGGCESSATPAYSSFILSVLAFFALFTLRLKHASQSSRKNNP